MEEKYEEILERLETIAHKMEQGGVPLDELTAQLEEANRLIKICKEKLLKTDAEVKKLTE